MTQHYTKDAMTTLAEMVQQNALLFPDKPALTFRKKRPLARSQWDSLTYREVLEQSDQFAFYLRDAGVVPGNKVILMVKPGPRLYIILLAMFKVGAIPVIVDPGMGLKRFLHCYKTVGAEVFIGTRKAYLIRTLASRMLPTIKINILVREKCFKGDEAIPFPSSRIDPERLAMIHFTTGSTGPAKGVEYTESMFVAMTAMFQRQFGTNSDSIELVTSPIFGLFALMQGAGVILPEMDPTKPARVKPENIIGPIQSFSVTAMFASPALLNRITPYAAEREIKLPSLKYVNSGGAPVTLATIETFRPLLSKEANFFTTWGATEGLPLSTIESNEILTETSPLTKIGQGTCIGLPITGIEVKAVTITDKAIPTLSSDIEMTTGQVGELIVSGANISKSYHASEESNRQLKITDSNGKIWHRTGDLGFMDAKGRVWFCGRMAHQVKLNHLNKTLYSVPCEGVTNAHPGVYRSALVGISNGQDSVTPIMCIELNAAGNKGSKSAIEKELLHLLSKCDVTVDIQQILFHPEFPVDRRHNAKIHREELAIWAKIQKETSHLREKQ